MQSLIKQVLLVCATLISANQVFAESRPNIVVVLCDDLGYGDLRCYGHPVVRTPHIDQFAEQSLKLTSCYAAAPNCSPARTGLMTGRTPYRVGVYNWIPFLSPMHVSESEPTIAKVVQQVGYQTCQFGKWHLNGWFNLPGQPQPNEMGFDYWFATQNNALPNHRFPYNFVRGGVPGTKKGIPVGQIEKYAAQAVVGEAKDWLTRYRDPSSPFFMYLCFHEPHEPIATNDEFSALYGFTAEPSKAAHHGNITQMDAAFGELLQTLKEMQLSESTIIIFTSDNGPAKTNRHPHGSSGPLRMHKGHLYEGGIRVPGLIHWPGVTQPGTLSDQPVSSVDLLPTITEIVGAELPQDHILDGISLVSFLRGKPLQRTKPLYWQFNYAQSWPKVAIRDGDWKLLANLDPSDQGNLTTITAAQMKALKNAQLDGYELYNLKDDIGEQHELSQSHPEQLQQMVKQMQAFYSEVQQASPTWPEWTWPKEEGQRIIWPDYPIPAK